ncbi:hypothetical protein rerp_36390 [Rhodococcus erythropolis]|nr:hypothetical protein rerp_36390 [Rhodococcus erythropolis]
MSSGIGWAASTLIQSPEQALVEADGPGETALYVPVERKIIGQSVVVRGSAVSTGAVDIEVNPGTAGKSILTQVWRPQGAQVSSGEAIVEVSGRPLIALQGAIPGYRDISPGMRGNDVYQLQQALGAAGYLDGEATGFFGEETKQGLLALYAALDYDVPLAGAAGQPREAERAAEDAVRAEADARDKLAALESGSAGAEDTQQAPSYERALSDARRVLSRAVEDAVAAREHAAHVAASTGPVLPLTEFAFVPTLPATVVTIGLAVGQEIGSASRASAVPENSQVPADTSGGEGAGAVVGSSALITLATGQPMIEAKLAAAQSQMIRAGMKVRIDSETSGRSATGTVESVGPPIPAANGARGTEYPVRIMPSESLDSGFSGDVRVTITAASSESAVLAVPVSAVYLGADGQNSIRKRGADGTEVTVRVNVGMTGDGYVEVAASAAGSPTETLSEGDQVLVGTRSGGK